MAAQLADSALALIDSVCGQYPLWAPRETRRPQIDRILSGGHSNCAVLLAGHTQRWVLRISDPGRSTAAQRLQEAGIHNAAADRGIAPPLRFYSATQGFILSDFIADMPLPGSDRMHGVTGIPDNGDAAREALATLLRKVHSLDSRGAAAMHSPSALQALQHALPESSEIARLLRRHAQQLRQASACIDRLDATAYVLCHNDLLRANRIATNSGYIAIDWEYAARGDPFFDLAVCASELSEVEHPMLLSAYLERPPSTDELTRLEAQTTLYLAIEACWYCDRDADSTHTEQAISRLRQRLQTTNLQFTV